MHSGRDIHVTIHENAITMGNLSCTAPRYDPHPNRPSVASSSAEERNEPIRGRTPPPSPPKPSPTQYDRPFPHKGYDPDIYDDVLTFMFETERDPETVEYPDGGPWSPAVRERMVNWLFEFAEHAHLQMTTAHTAVSLMDRVHATASNVKRSHLDIVKIAVVCTMIAAKMEEVDYVPSVSDVYDYDNGFKFSVSCIAYVEMEVLRVLKWKTFTRTALHFARVWLARGVLYTDEDRMAGRRCVSKVYNYIMRFVEFFAELCLTEASMRRFKESLLGASYIYVARKALRITPLWCEKLERVTTYSKDAIFECCEAVWDIYTCAFPNTHALREGKK